MSGPLDIVTIGYVVTIFTFDPNIGVDERMILKDLMTPMDCQEWAAEENSRPPEPIDYVTGKPVMLKYAGCAPITRDEVDGRSDKFSDVLAEYDRQVEEIENR